MPEPQKFFIGLTELFGILLPGAVMTFVLYYFGEPGWSQAMLSPMGTEAWIAFAIVSYFVGHLTFLLSSRLDYVYDWLSEAFCPQHEKDEKARRQADADKRKAPKRWERLKRWLWRNTEPFWAWWAPFFLDTRLNEARRCVVAIRDARLERIAGAGTINAYQWSKIVLTLEAPDAMAVAQRFEADSKFFRSLVVVLAVVGLQRSFHNDVIFAPVALAALPLALWRFLDQRGKAVIQVYWGVITLAAQAPKPPGNSLKSTRRTGD